MATSPWKFTLVPHEKHFSEVLELLSMAARTSENSSLFQGRFHLILKEEEAVGRTLPLLEFQGVLPHL